MIQLHRSVHQARSPPCKEQDMVWLELYVIDRAPPVQSPAGLHIFLILLLDSARRGCGVNLSHCSRLELARRCRCHDWSPSRASACRTPAKAWALLSLRIQRIRRPCFSIAVFHAAR